jgi:tetratricopeptide (TPR) repeat protein
LLDGKPSERDQRINLELAFARFAVEHGESQEARHRLERLLSEDSLPQQVRDEATLLSGIASDRLGDLHSAIHVVLPLFHRAQERSTHLSVAEIGMGLTSCYRRAGDLGQAISTGEAAIAASEAQGLIGTDQYYRLASTVMGAYMDRGDYIHARVWADRLLSEAELDGGRAGQAALYYNAAVLAEREGRLTEALHLCERAMAFFSELDNSRDYARLRLELANMLLVDDPPQIDKAEDLLSRVIEDLRDLGSRTDMAWWNRTTSITLLHRMDPSAAEARARQSLDLLYDAPPVERVGTYLALSDALAAQGRDEPAEEMRLQAFSELSQVPPTRSLSPLWREIGERLALFGNLDLAVEAFRKALDVAAVRDRSVPVRRSVMQLRASRDLADHA